MLWFRDSSSKQPSGNVEPAHLIRAYRQLRELFAEVAAWLETGGVAHAEVAVSLEAGRAHVADPADASGAVHSQHDRPDHAKESARVDRSQLFQVVVREHAGPLVGTCPSGSMTALPVTLTPMSRDSPLVLLIPSQSLALVENLTHTLSCFAARAMGCLEGSCSEVGRAAHG